MIAGSTQTFSTPPISAISSFRSPRTPRGPRHNGGVTVPRTSLPSPAPERRRGAPVVGGRSFRPARHQSVLRSCQFGLLSAPMFPHFEQIIRGPIAGTGTSSSQRLVVITTSWRHSWHAINRVDAVAPHVAERHGLDRNVGATWCHRLDPSPWYTEDGRPRPAGHRRRGAARTRDNRRPERRL
jgi:hypothetical protein